MGSIAAAIAAGQAYRQQYPNAAPVPEPTSQNLVQPVVSPLPPNGATGLPNRGVFPANIVLASDRSNNTQEFRTSNMRSPTFPYPPPIQPTKTTVETTVSESSGGSTLTIEVNNLKTPSQALLNFLSTPGVVWSSGPNGQIYATVTATSDGLIHGTTPWESDPSFFIIRDDFFYNSSGTTGGASAIGETGWLLENSTLESVLQYNGIPDHFGILQLAANNAANNYGYMFLQLLGASVNSTYVQNMASPLFDYPGWKYTSVFCFTRGSSGIGPLSDDAAFSMVQCSTYIGLAGGYGGAELGATNVIGGNRPWIFLGVRYDTDPGANITLNSVATGTGVYSGTITGGTSNGLVGQMIKITGFTNPASNGTFLCTASTSSTLTTNNSASVAGGSGTGATEALSDSTLKFEYVTNPTASTPSRNNAPGQVFDTGITPTEAIWYRLNMICATAGVVTLTLTGDDGSFATWTVTLTTVTFGDPNTLLSGTVKAANGVAYVAPSTSVNIQGNPFAYGSKITVHNGGSVPAGFLGAQVNRGGVTAAEICFYAALGTVGSTSCDPYITGFPAMLPYMSFGNDSTASPVLYTKALNIDFFSFIWNPGAANISATPNSSLSRYF